MKQKVITYPPMMVALAFILLAVDSGVSSGSIYDKLAVSGQAGQAFAFTLMFALVLFSISFTAFLKGLELAQQPHSAKRTTNLGVLGFIVAFLVVISLLMNAWFIGGAPMRQEWLNAFIEDVLRDGKSTNTLFEYAEDEKVTLKTISATTNTWLACERATGCVGKEGGGNGQTTLVLSNYQSTADNALNEIMDVSNEYQPIIDRANELYISLDFIPEMRNLSFDQKLDKAEEEIAKLSETFNELKNLLPIRTFENLADAYDASANQYIAQGISPVGSRTLFNYYNKHADRYDAITNKLKRGRLVHIQPMYKPSDWEILTSSSNGLFIWLMSAVLALFGWLMLGIHIIQNTRSTEENEDSGYSPPAAFNNTEAVPLISASAANSTKH